MSLYITNDPDDKTIIDCCNIIDRNKYEKAVKTKFSSDLIAAKIRLIDGFDITNYKEVELLYSREVRFYDNILPKIPIGVYYSNCLQNSEKEVEVEVEGNDRRGKVFCLCCNIHFSVAKYEYHCSSFVYKDYVVKQIENTKIITSLSSQNLKIKKFPSQEQYGIYLLDRIAYKDNKYIYLLTSKSPSQLNKIFKKYTESLYVMLLFPNDDHVLIEAYTEVVYQPYDENDNYIKVTTLSDIKNTDIEKIRLKINLVNGLVSEDCRYFYQDKNINFDHIVNCDCTECDIFLKRK